jgi:hypothetical protein
MLFQTLRGGLGHNHVAPSVEVATRLLVPIATNVVPVQVAAWNPVILVDGV